MTNHPDPYASPTLSADDPRLSEWIDGRLTAVEAAAVERAVRESPDLSRLVADLRAIKAAAGLVSTVSPPTGFIEQVMAAVAAGAGGVNVDADAAADRTVEQEWQAIEAERIADERAEAEVDKEEAARERPTAEPMSRRSWPWLAIGTALAAGLLVALAINRPDDAPREIARVEPAPQARRLDEVEKRSAAPAARMASPPAAERERAAEEFAAADEQLRQQQPQAAMATDARADADQLAAGNLAARKPDSESVAAARPPQPPATPPAPGGAAAARSAPLPAAPLVLTVGSWTEFDQLLEAHGIEARPLDAPGLGGRDKAGSTWNLELSGSAGGIDGFLAAARAGRLEDRLEVAEEKAKQAMKADAAADREKGEVGQNGQPADRTLVVRLVIRQPGGPAAAAGEQSIPADDEEGSP